MSLEIFRRNQRVLMAALTLMSMVSFVFLDETMRSGSTYLVPLILAILFGGGAFVWGTNRGKQNEYLAAGAIIGAVLGLVITTFGGRDPHERPAVAGLSPREIANLKNRRETANRIVSIIYRKSHPIPEQFLKAGPFGQQFYQMQMQRALEQIQFTFGNDDLEKDVIFGELLRRESERLGISVSDDAVSEFIKMVADQKLSTQDFREVKHELHIGDHYIYDILREELAARMAAEMTFPRATETPEQRWEDFRKIHVKNSIEATTIPVDAFVKSIPDPSDSELLAFFKEHSEKAPGPKGEIGFRQPARARLAYLEADYETIEGKVTPPTEEEIAEYYDDNKEFYIDRTPPKPETKEKAPEGDETKKPDGEEAKKSEEKKDGEKEKSDRPDGDKPKAESSKSDKPSEPEKPKTEKPADEPKKDAEKSEPQGAAGEDKVSGEKADESKKADVAKKGEPKPTAEKDEAKSPKSETEKADKSEKKEEAKTDEKKEKGDEKPKAESESKDEKPSAEKEKSDAVEKSDEKTEKKPELKYKPFEDVKDKIHDDLLRSRTLEEMKKRIETVVAKMRRLGSYTIAEKGSKSYKSPEEIASELRELGKSLDLKYVETPMLSAEELSKSEEFKIASATDPSDEATNRQGAASVIQRVFGRGSEGTHTPEVAEDLGTKNRFAYWVVDRKEAHVPTFDEEGVRDQVKKAWKLAKAAPKAEERAKALAKTAEDKKLTDVLAGETVTGEKDGQELTVIEPKEKFSHFSISGATVPGVNPFQGGNERVELAQIPGLEKLGDDFFTAIDKLKPGQTAAIPNYDRSAFVVVHVTEREDVSSEEDAPQRSDFLKTWPFSPPANELARFDFDPLRREWMQSIERKYNVNWPVK